MTKMEQAVLDLHVLLADMEGMRGNLELLLERAPIEKGYQGDLFGNATTVLCYHLRAKIEAATKALEVIETADREARKAGGDIHPAAPPLN